MFDKYKKCCKNCVRAKLLIYATKRSDGEHNQILMCYGTDDAIQIEEADCCNLFEKKEKNQFRVKFVGFKPEDILVYLGYGFLLND